MTARDANQILQTGDMYVLYKDYATGAALPANTVLAGTVWSTYTDGGYTDGGLSLNIQNQYGESRVDQEPDPLFRPFQSRTLELRFPLAEFTAPNINLGSGTGTLTTTAAISGTRGQDELVIGSGTAAQYKTWGYDFLQPNSEAFRILVPKGQASGSANPTVSRTQKGLLNTQITAILDTSFSPARAMVIRDVIPALP